MAVRSSLYKKDLSTHVHEFENEIYDEDKENTYSVINQQTHTLYLALSLSLPSSPSLLPPALPTFRIIT